MIHRFKFRPRHLHLLGCMDMSCHCQERSQQRQSDEFLPENHQNVEVSIPLITSRPFEEIEENIYMGYARKIQEDEQSEECKCVERCLIFDDPQCINFSTQFECPPSCHNGIRCYNKNLRIQNYSVDDVDVRDTKEKGKGLFALRPFVEDELIGEFVGEVYERNHFAALAAEDPIRNQYAIVLNQTQIIDPTYRGNKFLFINHSCAPNAAVLQIIVDGVSRLAVRAKQLIHIGEEITFNYLWKITSFKCYCKAPNCRGTF